MRSSRAICPNCGGKIHTQPKGLGHIAWTTGKAPGMRQTGGECQHCGVELTGKIDLNNRAKRAEPELSSGYDATRDYPDPGPLT